MIREMRAAEELNVPPAECVVFEDAEAGIEAALRAGMKTVGVGKPSNLKKAETIIPGLFALVMLSAH